MSQADGPSETRAGGGASEMTARRSRKRWQLLALLQVRFLVPVLAGGFALFALATVFQNRYARQTTRAPLSVPEARSAATQSRVLEGLRSNSRAPERPAPPALVARKVPAHVAGIPVAVRSPDGDATWHVGPHGFISIVAVNGNYYLVAKQKSGVTADLLGGDAVSAQICWVVGRGGTILRTTDGGYHWQRVKSPTQADIEAVSAQSADAATILTKAGTKFSTADSGQHWTRK